MNTETDFENLIRIIMDATLARGLLKEIVRVHALPADTSEAADVGAAELARLCQMAQEELDAPPRFVKIPRRRWSFGPAFAHAK